MSNITLIGPITNDTIVKNKSTYKSIGGAVYYQSSVLDHLEINTKAIITVAKSDEGLLDDFSKNTELFPIFKDETIKFQNIYPDNNPNHRIQKAYIPCNSIEFKDIASLDLKDCDAILLGPLYHSDIPLETVEYLSKLKIPIYLGAQGYLRHLRGDKIVLRPWNDFKKFLKYVKVLFMDENEGATILGEQLPLNEITKILASFGPDEVVITQGSNGSTIYSKKLDEIYKIPAFTPKKTEDPTGLGDTYMAAYAARKLKTEDPKACGIFASAASVIKLENKGAFKGNIELIQKRCKTYSEIMD